jgi:hypothetical protein
MQYVGLLAYITVHKVTQLHIRTHVFRIYSLLSCSVAATAAAVAGDDTGLNAVSMQCKNATGSITATEILSYGGLWGSWSAVSNCPGFTYAVAVALRVLPDQGSGDDIAADAVRLTCSDNTTVLGTPNALGLGTWGPTAR